MKIRTMFIALLLAVLMLIPAVSAQDLDPCLGLSETDCALINSANENTMATVNSFTQTFSIDFSVTGVPGGDLSFSLQGSGPVMDLSGENPAFDAVMDVQFSSPDGESGAANVEALLVDGILYVRDTSADAWTSINLEETMTQLSDPDTMSGLFESMGLPINPAMMAGGGGDMSEADQQMMMTMMGVMGQAMVLVETPGFLGYVRDGDNFVFTMDILPVLNSPEFDSLGATLGQSENTDLAQAAAALPMLKTLIQEGKITATQKVDEANNLVTGVTFTTDFTVAAGETPIVLSLTFNVDLTDVNGTFTIVAPDPANVTEMPMSLPGGGE